MFLLWLGRAVAADWKLRLWCRESNVTPMVGTNLYCLFLFLFSLGFLPFFILFYFIVNANSFCSLFENAVNRSV